MIRIPVLDERSEELEVKFKHDDRLDSKITFTNVYGVLVAEVDLFTYKNGVGKFRLTNEIHALPFGRYIVTVFSGKCCCGCFPVDIPKCSINMASVNERVNDTDCKVDQPIRDCDPKKVKKDCCDNCCCDECKGCDDCHPCDVCHPCYTDKIDNYQGRVEGTVVYSDEAKEVLFQ